MAGRGRDLDYRNGQGKPGKSAIFRTPNQDDLGIPIDANLDSLLKYCGYDNLTAREIEVTPSDQLMARFPGDIIASRFFAPKIIDVSNVGAPASQKKLGWRKVVRLRAKGDPASARGITQMFLLFNVF